MEEKKYGVVIRTSGLVELVDFPEENKLDWYYQTIGCDCIDIVKPYALEEIAEIYGLASILGKFSMVVDDEGLLVAEPKVNAIASLLYGADRHGQALFGDVIVVKDEVTPDGVDSIGMNDEDVTLLHASIHSLVGRHNEKVKEGKHGGS